MLIELSEWLYVKNHPMMAPRGGSYNIVNDYYQTGPVSWSIDYRIIDHGSDVVLLGKHCSLMALMIIWKLIMIHSSILLFKDLV